MIDSIGAPNMLRILVFSSSVLVKSKQNASTSSLSVILQTIILIRSGRFNGSFLKLRPFFCEHKYFKKVDFPAKPFSSCIQMTLRSLNVSPKGEFSSFKSCSCLIQLLEYYFSYIEVSPQTKDHQFLFEPLNNIQQNLQTAQVQMSNFARKLIH